MNSITILGEGAWGSALAQQAAHAGAHVMLWCHDPAVAQEMNTKHTDTRYAPGFTFHTSIRATESLHAALTHSNIILVTTPIRFLRSVLELCKKDAHTDHIWISCTKGLEGTTGMRPTEIIQEILAPKNYGVLLGPSFAQDVRNGLFTIICCATNNPDGVDAVRLRMNSSNFICTAASSIDGMEYCAVLKNCMAMGVGFLEGSGCGMNTVVALVLALMEEIKLVLAAAHAPQEALYAYSGIGDIMLTCFGVQSRNRAFGIARGKGIPYEDAIGQIGRPEALETLHALSHFEQRHGVQLPLFSAIRDAILSSGTAENIIALVRHSSNQE